MIAGGGVMIGVTETGALSMIKGDRNVSIGTADDENALVAYTEINTDGIPNNDFQEVSELSTNIEGDTEISYTLSTDEDAVSIRFDGETSVEGGSLSGTIVLDDLASEGIELECSTPGLIDDDNGWLTLDISEAAALNQNIGVSGLEFQTRFFCGDPPSGTVDLQDTIFATDSDFDVTYTFENTDAAYLVVTNDTTSQEWAATVTDADGDETIDASEVGGLSEGDTITATLWDTDDQNTMLDNSERTVADDSDTEAELVSRQFDTFEFGGGGAELSFDIEAAEAVKVTNIDVEYDDGDFDDDTTEIDGNPPPVTFDGVVTVTLARFENPRLDNRGSRDFDPEFVDDSTDGNIDVTFTFYDSSELVLHINAPTR